jgi:hypothetical protein
MTVFLVAITFAEMKQIFPACDRGKFRMKLETGPGNGV